MGIEVGGRQRSLWAQRQKVENKEKRDWGRWEQDGQGGGCRESRTRGVLSTLKRAGGDVLLFITVDMVAAAMIGFAGRVCVLSKVLKVEP